MLAFVTIDEFPLLSRAREIIVLVQSRNSYDRLSIPDGPTIVSSLLNLAIGFYNKESLPEAEELAAHALRIQECINHPMHRDLLRPLIMLGAVHSRQRQFDAAEKMFLRALVIVGKTDAQVEEHRLALANLCYVYQQLDRMHDLARMQSYLERLHQENPFLIKDRPSKPSG